VFEKTVSECPDWIKPWVSWAQVSVRGMRNLPPIACVLDGMSVTLPAADQC
jgi:hypothetical protein